MGNKANDTFAFDLENRLDDFFSDPEPSPNEVAEETAAPTAPTESGKESSLKALKSTILAIDWEITDEALATFIGQVEELAVVFKADKVNHTLLKILKVLGKYIRKYKSAAHPDTIKRIMAVYSALEEVVDNQGLSQKEKEKVLREEVRQFQQLKASITAGKSPAAPAPKLAAAAANADLAAVISAIESLKTMMTTELGAIREEITKLGKK